MYKKNNIDIYRFDDFRLYLKQRFDAMQTADSSITQRTFAGKAGFSNPGYFNDIIKGRRKISKAALEKLVAVFSMDPAEEDFFKLLVSYGQTKTAEDKQNMYHKIISRRNRSSFSRVNPAMTRYYQDYRYPLIRNALMAIECTGNFEDFSRCIYPPLPSTIVKKIVLDLCDWGLAQKDATGRYAVTEKFIEPAPTLKEQIRQINREWISHGIDALMKLPPEKRHISSRLISVSAISAKRITEKIEKLRDEIWQMVKDDSETPSCVMQLNIQYFPRTVAKYPQKEKVSGGSAYLKKNRDCGKPQNEKERQ
jgi:uncharacterized protein (TIGR02147 family)